MNRKDFLKQTGLITAGTIAAPYILPAGTLSRRTNAPKAEYVVMVMFAGGVRQQESILQRYLADSQDLPGYEGNIMYNMFEGSAPTKKIAYGTDPAGQPAGSDPIPKLLSSTMQKQGTVFKEVKAASAGHFVGLNSLITGNPGYSQGLKQRPKFPTIFEYLRRHAGFKATDCWYVVNTLTNSYNLLNSSEVPEYGLDYGGNMIVAPYLFSGVGKEILGNSKTYSQSDLEPMYFMKNFLDNSFGLSTNAIKTIRNTDEEKTKIKDFIRNMYIKQQSGLIARPPIADNGDALNISYAAETLKTFKPKLLVVNLSAVDGCHSNFTGYLRSLHRADHSVAWLWNYIQTQIPEMAGKTIMMIAPECGRNLKPNPIQDTNDWYAYDHSDANAMRVWSVMLGKNVPSNMQFGSEANPVGRLTDIVPTIADIFGIYSDVKSSKYIDSMADSFYNRM